MAAYISFQPSDFFSPKIYTGTGATNALTGVGFQPDFTWIKDRDGGNSHMWTDAVRGSTSVIESNGTGAAATQAAGVTSYDSDGFTLGTYSGMNSNTVDFVSWNWKMGTTSGLTGGTITPSAYSISATAGQSVIAYTGTGSNATIPHGLGKAPVLIICKQYDTGRNWATYWGTLGATKYIPFTDVVAGTSSAYWNDTEPTSTVFSVGTQDETNGTGTIVAYCFTDVKGYSASGSYYGTGNADGPFVYTGFRPACIILKEWDGTNSWQIWDDKRAPYNVANAYLQPSTTSADITGNNNLDLLSNGFKLRSTNTANNGAGQNFAYMAFAEFPFVSSNSKASTAR